jgi:hypothetical protein
MRQCYDPLSELRIITQLLPALHGTGQLGRGASSSDPLQPDVHTFTLPLDVDHNALQDLP